MWIEGVMTRRVVAIAPDTSVIEAAKLMGEANVGCLVVLDKEELVGLITDRDIVTRVIARELDLMKCKVSDCMTSEVVTAIPQTDILEAARLMTHYGVRRLPVADGKNLVGIVSIADVASYAESILGEVSKTRKR